MRRLMVTGREVRAARAGEYDLAWRALRDSATTAGGRAWRFRRGPESDAYLEFIEWSNDNDMEQTTAPLRAQLDRIAPGRLDNWQECP